MTGFPALDPIPLPAPVWLLKALHVSTLSLHFVAVQILLGGLLAASLLNLIGRTSEPQTASAAMARRLPIVMTYVINLGVPPLLFAQVLYGRALYTSSVLIGVYWIAVIPLLMACYWLLYRFAGRVETGRRGWWLGLGALAIAGIIARIYTSNMTLMLRPEVWPDMYAKSALGAQLPQGDPTLAPRWFFMLGGGLMLAGLWMLYLAGRSTFSNREKRFLTRAGGPLAAVMALAQVIAGWRVFQVQPEAVRAGLQALGLYRVSGDLWLVALVLIVLIGLWSALTGRVNSVIRTSVPIVAILAAGSVTLFRDGIRDLTLLSKGFDVWQRTVVTNWVVVGLFLALFLAGLGALGWLTSVVARARPVKEGMA